MYRFKLWHYASSISAVVWLYGKNGVKTGLLSGDEFYLIRIVAMF